MAKELDIPKNSARMRIKRENIAPLFNGSIYPPDTYDRIKDAKVGRPRNPDIEEAEATVAAIRDALKTDDAARILEKVEAHAWSMIKLATAIKGSSDEELLNEANEARLDRPFSAKEINAMKKALESIKNPKSQPPENPCPPAAEPPQGSA